MTDLTFRYDTEAALMPHYDDNLQYYSPLQDRDETRKIFDAVGIRPERAGSVLDVGCGDGRLAAHFLPRTQFVGVDASEPRVQMAVGKFPNHQWFCGDVYAVLEDLDQIRQDDNDNEPLFDLGVAVEVLEHLENPEHVVELMRRLCVTVLGTVPINMPYEAHLQVYEDVDAVHERLSPERVATIGEHFVCRWPGKTG